MANCSVCGSVFAPTVGKPIDEENKNIIICPKCNANKLKYIQYMRNNEIGQALDLYSYFRRNVEHNMKNDLEKEIITNVIFKLAEPYPDVMIQLRDQESEIKLEIENKKQEEYNRSLAVEKFKKNVDSFMLTSGYDFEGYKITKYYKVISASTVLGTGMFSELFASISDTFGVTSNAFEVKMDQAKDMAQKKLILAACQYDANAIIGIDFDYLTIGNNMIAVSANGTVVRIEKL